MADKAIATGRSVPTALRELLDAKYRATAALAFFALAGGVIEAGFLVVVTRAALAITADEAVRVPGLGEVRPAEAAAIGAVLLVLRFGAGMLVSHLASTITSSSTRRLRMSLVDAWLSSSWEAKGTLEGGQLQELIGPMAHQGTALVQSFVQATTAGLNLVAVLAMAVLVDPTSALVLAFVVAALSQAVRPIRSAVRRQGAAAVEASLAGSNALNEMSQLRTEIHTFHSQDAFHDRLDRVVSWYERVSRKLDFLRSTAALSYTSLAYLAVVVVLLALDASGPSAVDRIGPVMLLMLRSLSYGQVLQSSVTAMAAAGPHLDEIRHRRDGLAAQRTDAPTAPGAHPGAHSLEVRNVTFSYPGGSTVLKNASLRVEPGEIIGLAGPSGSGKSTLASVVLRLREPAEGRIEAGGVNVTELDLETWARWCAFVPQRPRLIAGSLRDNIRWFRPWISDDHISRAIEHAQLSRDFVHWPMGLDHTIADGGDNLSGGQQQRICIARALAGSPSLLVLDEPTSALDPSSEAGFIAVLNALRGRTSVLVIAHRDSTLAVCDRVLNLSNGQPVHSSGRVAE